MNYREPEFEFIMLKEDIITLSSDEWGSGGDEDLTGVNSINLE